MNRDEAELRLRGALGGVRLDEQGAAFVRWVERSDADAIDGLAAVVEATYIAAVLAAVAKERRYQAGRSAT